MKKIYSVILMLTVLLNGFNIIPKAYSAETDIRIFKSFEDYSAPFGYGIKPNGVYATEDARSTNFGSADYDDLRYENALKVGTYGTGNEPIIPFDKILTDEKLHVTFDVLCEDPTLKRCLVGFYKNGGTANNNDPYSWDETSYAKTIWFQSESRIMHFQDDYISGYLQGYDMSNWNYIESGMTYSEDTWYRVDLVLDMSTRKAQYYVNGEKVNEERDINFKKAGNFKALMLRVEPLVSTDALYQESKASDACYVFDNISINTYDNGKSLILSPTQSCVSHKDARAYIRLSDYVDNITADKIYVKNSNNDLVDFTLEKADADGFLIKLDNPIKGEVYSVGMSNVTGKLTGAENIEEASFTIENDGYIVYESFNDGVGNEFSGGMQAYEEGLYGKCVSLPYSATAKTMTYTVDEPIDEDTCTIEFYTKTKYGFDLNLQNSGGTQVKLIGINSNGVVGRYKKTARGYSIEYTDSECVVSTSSGEWSKVKVKLDKENDEITVTTGASSYKAECDVPDDISQIQIKNNTGYSGETLIDDLKVYSGEITNCAVEFVANDEKAQSGVFYSVANTNELDAKELICAKGLEADSSYYMINRENGTIKLDIDADTSVSCDGYKELCVEVSYVDKDYGWFALKYYTPDGVKYTESACMLDSGENKTHKFYINDAVLNQSNAKWDFELVTYTTEKDGKVSSTDRTYSKFPVLINKISLQNTGVDASIDVEATSDNTGNIFFGDETPRFSVSLNSNNESNVDVTAIVKVYKLDNNMQKSFLYEQSFDKALGAGGTESFELLTPVDDYGLYSMDIDVKNANLNISTTETVPFSKCIENDTLNMSAGVSGGFSHRGDVKAGFPLLVKAGFGNERDDISWGNYEKTQGVYALDDWQEEILLTAKENGLRFLPILNQGSAIYSTSYDSFLTHEKSVAFGDFAYNFAKEPLVKDVVDGIEIWNEPSLKGTDADGKTQIDDNYEKKGKMYADTLREAYTGIQKAEQEIGKEYTVAGFSLTSVGQENLNFLDAGLNELSGVQAFDTISLHPYTSSDPEKGYGTIGSGTWYDYVPSRYEAVRSLAQGTPRMFEGEPVDETYPNGIVTGGITGNTYDFELRDGLYLTEFGFSTAKYDLDGLCCADEYWQAERLVRMFNTMRENNFSDKMWIHTFMDSGERINEKEFKFGIVHSPDDKVPYHAKYAYLAMSAYNRLTGSATACEEVYNTDYAFITKYDFSDDKKAYFCISTTGTHNVDFDFGENLKYYDLLGNEIAPRTESGQHIIDDVPYYVVSNGELTSSDSEEKSLTAYILDDVTGVINPKLSDFVAEQSSLVVEGLEDGQSCILVFAYFKDERLADTRVKDDFVSGEKKFALKNYMTDKEYDNIKVLVCDGYANLKPLTEGINIE